MEFLGYFLGGLGLGLSTMAIYHARIIIRLKREGYIEYPILRPPTDETFMLRED